MRGGNADAVVLDPESGDSIALSPPDSDLRLDVLRHEFDGVGEEINQDVLQGRFVAKNLGQGRSNLDLSTGGARVHTNPEGQAWLERS